jgi:FkbM family methyltransferase
MKSKDGLLAELSSRIAQSKNRYCKQLLRHPLKMLYPKMLSTSKQTHRVKALTFWGGEITVILPELVATKVWRYGFFEGDVCAFMLAHLQSGMNVLDIGAHYGFFTLLASYLIGEKGKVLSFEPSPSTFALLVENTNNYRNIKVLNYAAYDQDGGIDFFDFGVVQSAFNSAFGVRLEGEHQTRVMDQSISIKVEARRLDSLMANEDIRVDCVKIDAESSEMAVLRGVEATIQRDRPMIIIELGDYQIQASSASADIVNWLMERGYMPYEFRNSIQPHELKNEYDYCNLLFLDSRN